jgi:hypothetical protein
VTERSDSVGVGPQESRPNQCVGLGECRGVQRCVSAGDDGGVRERLGHSSDVEGRGYRQHPLRRPQYGVAVEIGHHETTVGQQHLTYVQITVSLDDRGACECAETMQNDLHVAAARTRDRHGCVIG